MDPQAGPYSLYAPPGLHQYASGKPAAQALHETILELFSKHGADEGGLSTEPGSLVDLFSFALAIALTRAVRTGERADGERFDQAYYLLAEFEREYGLHPGAGETLKTRRDALALAKLLPRGNNRAEVEQALRDALGDDYVGLHLATGGEVVSWPEDLGDMPQNLLEASVERKVVTVNTGLSTGLGVPQAVYYTPVDPNPDIGHTLAVGDRLVIEPENLGRAEVVTVENLAIDDPSLLFTATFYNAHEPGCMAVQMPFPAWGSSAENLLVALSITGAIDPEVRRKADEVLRKVLQGITTWNLCPLSSPTTIGPWTLGDPRLSRLRINPMATITVP